MTKSTSTGSLPLGERLRQLEKDVDHLQREQTDIRIEMAKNTTRLTLVVAFVVGCVSVLATVLTQWLMKGG